MFNLCWTQHGGSGLGFTYQDVLGLTLDERDWYLEQVSKERKHEQSALRRAAARRK